MGGKYPFHALFGRLSNVQREGVSSSASGFQKHSLVYSTTTVLYPPDYQEGEKTLKSLFDYF